MNLISQIDGPEMSYSVWNNHHQICHNNGEKTTQILLQKNQIKIIMIIYLVNMTKKLILI